MPSHAGQVAFVGGHRQAGEASPWEVAQREYEEEMHLSRETIGFLGYLPTVMTARGQTIAPVIGELKISLNDFMMEVKSNGEWDEIIVYPWSKLVIEETWEFARRFGDHEATPVMFHTIKSGSYITHGNNDKPHILWGATAGMIWSLLKRYFA